VCFLSLTFISQASPHVRAPREDGSSVPCAQSSCNVEIDSIRQCVCSMNSTLNTLVTQGLGECRATTITNSDQENGVITLSTDGNYRLGEDISYPIVIDSNDVCLNLCCRSIEISNPAYTAIRITSGKRGIRITNGRIGSISGPGSGSGILVNSGVSKIHLAQLEIFNFGYGVKFEGTHGNEIIESELVAIDFTACSVGVRMDHSNDNRIEQCNATHCLRIGFDLVQCEGNCIVDCKAVETVGPQTVIGFRSESGSGNLFKECVAKKSKVSAVEFSNKAYGFLLTGTENDSKIVDCIVNEVETEQLETSSALAYGIALEPTLFPEEQIFDAIYQAETPLIEGDNRTIAWSPNERYMASSANIGLQIHRNDYTNLVTLIKYNVASYNHGDAVWSPDGHSLILTDSRDDATTIYLFSFNESDVILLQSIGFSTSPDVMSVAWSPDGQYVAFGLPQDIHLYRFTGTSLIQIPVPAGFIGNLNGQDIRSLSWSPDGLYLVAGSDVAGNDTGKVTLFTFDGRNLRNVTDLTLSGTVLAIEWSPSGKVVAAGTGNNVNSDGHLYLIDFEQTSFSIMDDTNIGETVNSVSWSPYGKYITITHRGTMNMFGFDGEKATSITSYNFNFAYTDWSPSGAFLVAARTFDKVYSYQVMTTPVDCLIAGCKVCGVLAFKPFVGTGMIGGLEPYYFENISCNNEVDYAYGIPNVFHADHNTMRPFDNIASQIPRFIRRWGNAVILYGPRMAMA